MVQQSNYRRFFSPGNLREPVSFYRLLGLQDEVGQPTDDMVLVKDTFAMVLEDREHKDKDEKGDVNVIDYILITRKHLDVDETQKVVINGVKYNIKTILRTKDNWMVTKVSSKDFNE